MALKMKFDWPIIGHRQVVRYLETAFINGSIGHAYIFAGPASIGKMSVAKLFAQTLLCERAKSDANVPCNGCSSCNEVRRGTHPDLYTLHRAQGELLPIEKLRSLRSSLSLRPLAGYRKVAIIEEAEYLSPGAANALLKTLEEPSPHTTLILTSSSPDRLMRTISSRCQMLFFSPAKDEDIVQSLIARGTPKQRAIEIAAVASGRQGVALSMMDETAYDDFQNSLSVITRLLTDSPMDRFTIIESILPKSVSSSQDRAWAEETFSRWSLLLRDAVLVSSGMKRSLPSTRKHYVDTIARKHNSAKLNSLLRFCISARKLIQQNVQIRLIFESFALSA